VTQEFATSPENEPDATSLHLPTSMFMVNYRKRYLEKLLIFLIHSSTPGRNTGINIKAVFSHDITQYFYVSSESLA
jgi:hypothetical protein